MEKNIPILEKFIKESGSGFFAKSGISWVDFSVASFTETMENLKPELLHGFKEIIAHKERVYALPQLKKYLEKRPKTVT